MNVLPRFLAICLLLATLLLRASPAAAQESGTLSISTPEVDAFPTINFRLDAYTAQGEFIDDLKADEVTITEDGQPLKVQTLEKARKGLQTIVALNISPAMANKSGITTSYQTIQAALIAWAATLDGRTGDDFSFSTPTGLFLIREHDPLQLVKAFTDYQPDLPKAQSSLGSLAEALDLATDPLSQAGMKRAILFITPPLPDDVSQTVVDLTDRAKNVGVRVSVWQVSPSGAAAAAKPVNPLEQLALQTGGKYQVLLPNTPLPEIDPLFQPLRNTYQVSYQSAIRDDRQHSLQVKINRPDLAEMPLTSSLSRFNFSILPPNPIFISPPAAVERSWLPGAKSGVSALTPDQVNLQIMIEFPDHHPRAIKATRLYVNDQLVQENTTEPFDKFTWQVTDLTTASRQMLRVEAEDALNLTGHSIETPVDITVDQPAAANLTEKISGRGMIAIGSVAAAGSVLALVLILTNTQRRWRGKRSQADVKRLKDPVTQPVQIPQDPSKPTKSKPLFGRSKPAAQGSPSKPAPAWPTPSWPRPGALSAPARLITLDDTEQPVTGGVILLSRQEITLGKDPRRATQVFDSPTIDDLHARLYRDPEGHFYLADQDSVAGTWINFAPVTNSGARLEHGDLIHIGKLMFRFELTDQNRAAPVEVKVTDLDLKP